MYQREIAPILYAKNPDRSLKCLLTIVALILYKTPAHIAVKIENRLNLPSILYSEQFFVAGI